MIILGLDISLHCTGWAVVDTNTLDTDINNVTLHLLDYGYIDTHKLTEPKALLEISKTLRTIMDTYQIDAIASEAPFVGKNAKTIQQLAKVHGVASLIAAEHDVKIVNYSVMTMKSATLGKMKLKNADGTRKTGKELKQEVANRVIDIIGQQALAGKDYTDDVSFSVLVGRRCLLISLYCFLNIINLFFCKIK